MEGVATLVEEVVILVEEDFNNIKVECNQDELQLQMDDLLVPIIRDIHHQNTHICLPHFHPILALVSGLDISLVL